MLYFQSIDPSRNRFRWYLLDLQADLFGGVNLVRRWGRIGRPGRTSSEHFPDESAASSALAVEVRRRAKHGYCQDFRSKKRKGEKGSGIGSGSCSSPERPV
jgi:predicted DNA-binding WGR domain protein